MKGRGSFPLLLLNEKINTTVLLNKKKKMKELQRIVFGDFLLQYTCRFFLTSSNF